MMAKRLLIAGLLAFLLPSGTYADPPGDSQPSAKSEGVPEPVPGDSQPCERHQLKAGDVKQRLRRWYGLGAFNRWRLKEVSLNECVEAGSVGAELSLAPPDGWSLHRVPYRVRVRLRLDAASGSALRAPGQDYRQLASAVRRLVLRAEEHEDVRRFLERFPPDRAEVAWANGPERLRVNYRSLRAPETERAVELSYSEAAEEGVVAYRLPRMDSLPVRRELLHFVEVLSQRHPRCRPSWIEARWRSPQPDAEGSGRWTIKMDLEGPGCPEFLRGEVTPEWTVTDLDVAMPGPAE
jgi:hypothetical protein